MVLVVGGMAQGKLDFARQALGVAAWSEGALGPEGCVHGLHLALRALPDPAAALDRWLAEHPEGVLICDEVGGGVTPLDREGRKQEIARIIGGAAITETTLRSAEEMLAK